MVSPSPQPGPPGAAAPPARVGQQSGGEEEGLEATSPGSFRESPGRGRPQEAPAPSTSPPPSTRGGSGARVLRRLQHLQNTAYYSEYRQNRATLSLLEPRNLVCAQEMVTLNPRRGGQTVKTHIQEDRGFTPRRVLTFPQDLSPPCPISIPGAPPSPAALRNADGCKAGGGGGVQRKGYFSSPKCPFTVPRVLYQEQAPQNTRVRCFF